MTDYHFDIEDAKKYGVDEAIIIYNFRFWISKNIANRKHNYEGRTWTYNSMSALEELFPFWTSKQIRRIIDSLVEKQVLIKGNFNKIKFDRTIWYAFNNEELFHLPKWSNGSSQMGEPIPYNKPDNKPYTNKKFVKPSIEEVKQYCIERNNTVDAEVFIDYYESKGWMIGKNHMKDWKAAIRTWERNRTNKKPTYEKQINDVPKGYGMKEGVLHKLHHYKGSDLFVHNGIVYFSDGNEVGDFPKEKIEALEKGLLDE